MKAKRLFEPKDYAENIVIPQGKARWAVLKDAKGYQGDTEVEHHSCDVLISEAEAQPIMDTVQGIMEKILDVCGKDNRRMQIGNNRPWRTHDDDPEKIPAGFVQFKTKKRAFRANGNKPATPPIPTYVDGQKIDWSTAEYGVGNDSVIQIACTANPYYIPASGLGVTLQLKAVKVLELNKYVAGESGDKFYENAFADGTTTKKTEAGPTGSDDNYFD